MTTLRTWFDVLDIPPTAIIELSAADHGNGFVLKAGEIINPGWPTTPYKGPLANLDPQVLDLEFDSSYGSVGCPYFVIWTSDRVYWRTEYDGSTGIESVSRNP